MLSKILILSQLPSKTLKLVKNPTISKKVNFPKNCFKKTSKNLTSTFAPSNNLPFPFLFLKPLPLFLSFDSLPQNLSLPHLLIPLFLLLSPLLLLFLLQFPLFFQLKLWNIRIPHIALQNIYCLLLRLYEIIT